jgi:hypothetical protein
MAAPDPTAGDTSGSVTLHPIVVADAAIGRAAARASFQFVLRSLHMVAREGGDLMTGIVLYGVAAGNVGHLDQDPNNPSPYGSIENIPPDDARRPVSVLGVANSLGLPYETTRRYVNVLMKTGQCVRVKGGIIAPGAVSRGPEEERDLLDNVANLRRLYRALKRLSVNLD